MGSARGSKAVAAAVRRGGNVVVDLGVGDAAQDDVAGGGGWGSERLVDASVLVDLLTQPVSGSERRRSVRVRGARIVGPLDLDDATLTGPVWLQGCFFDEPMTMNRARAAAVHLTGSHLPGLQARQLRTEGDLDLSEVTATEIGLLGAEVAGCLQLRDARLTNPDGVCWNGVRMTVGQGLFASGLVCQGEVTLLGATIENGLSLTGATLSNDHGWALDAQGMSVGYALFMGNSIPSPTGGFTAAGGIRLVGVTVDGFVSLRGADISAHPSFGYAIAGRGLSVTGSFYADQGLRVRGGVHLRNASVGEDLDLQGASLEGDLDLTGSTVTGTLDLGGLRLTNPAASTVHLGGVTAGELSIRSVDPRAVVDLRNADVQVLSYGPQVWGIPHQVRDLRYSTVTGLAPGDLSATLVPWLRRDPDGFSNQPYEQLRSMLRRSGHEDEARKVAIERQRSQRVGRTIAGKAWDTLLYMSVRYGYQPWRAGIALAALIAIGAEAFHIAWDASLMTAMQTPARPFNSIAYSFDLLVPIVDLGQKSSWTPTSWGLSVQWTFVVIGWVLTTAVAAGITNRLRRD